MKKNAIISFANSNGYYMDRMARLSNSLRDNFDGDFIGFVGEASLGCPLHSENPYAFKIYAFEKAFNVGYEKVIWLDSSVFAIAPVNPLFYTLDEQELIFQDAGHYLGNWSNDYVLNYFNITRDDAMNMKMIGNAGFLGINIETVKGLHFFEQWQKSMENGCFKGQWHNNDNTESNDVRCLGSRHDMSCSSAIVHKMGLFDLAYGGEEVLQYAGIYDKVLNDTIILKAQG